MLAPYYPPSLPLLQHPNRTRRLGDYSPGTSLSPPYASLMPPPPQLASYPLRHAGAHGMQYTKTEGVGGAGSPSSCRAPCWAGIAWTRARARRSHMCRSHHRTMGTGRWRTNGRRTVVGSERGMNGGGDRRMKAMAGARRTGTVASAHTTHCASTSSAFHDDHRLSQMLIIHLVNTPKPAPLCLLE
jgi:hypothetical protein